MTEKQEHGDSKEKVYFKALLKSSLILHLSRQDMDSD